MATRHLARSIVLQSLYEWDFNNKSTDLVKIVERNMEEFGPGINEPDFIWKMVKGVIEHLTELNDIISKSAIEWPFDQITLIDRNVLRLGVYELIFVNHEEVPYKVAINESIELAKNYGGINSGRFVNGVLGTVYKQIEQVTVKDSVLNSEEKEEKNKAE